MLPAKIIPSKGYAGVSFNEKEVAITQFEALIGSGYIWVPSSNGNVPANAVMSGYTSSREPLFIGRCAYKGSVTPGKVHKSHGCLYIPYGGKEVSSKNYDVLVAQVQKAAWIPWVSTAGVPQGAVFAGNDSDGSQIYIGRATHEGDIIPAKVIPSKQVAYICFNGLEIAKHQFEILCGGQTRWVGSGNGQVPAGAIPAGRTRQNEILFIGRGSHAGSLTVGKVQPSHATLYIPYGGKEIALKSYEVLIE